MEVALWTAIGSALAVMAKGATVGDGATPDEQQKVIADLQEARKKLEEHIRTMEADSKRLDLKAKKDLLIEERDKKITENRETKAAEAVWARATPETLIAFAKERIALKVAEVVSTEPIEGLPVALPVDGPVEAPPVAPPVAPPAVAPEIMSATGKGGVDLRIGDEASCQVYNTEETGKITRFVEKSGKVYVHADKEDGSYWEQPADSCSKKLKQDGGAQTTSIDAVYQTLVDSAIARGYTIRGSLVGFYSKIVDAWKQEKGDAALPAELEKARFLKEAARDIEAAEEKLSGEKATAKAERATIAEKAKEARTLADEAVSTAKQALSDAPKARQELTAAVKKLRPLMVSLSGRQCLGDDECGQANRDAETQKNTADRLLRESETYEADIGSARDTLAEKRKTAVVDEQLPAHLSSETAALNTASGTLTKNTAEIRALAASISSSISKYSALVSKTSTTPLFTGVSYTSPGDVVRPAMDVPAAPAPVAGPVAAPAAPAMAPTPPAADALKTEIAKTPNTLEHEATRSKAVKALWVAESRLKDLAAATKQLQGRLAVLPKPEAYKGGCAAKVVADEAVSLAMKIKPRAERKRKALKTAFDKYTKLTKEFPPTDEFYAGMELDETIASEKSKIDKELEETLSEVRDFEGKVIDASIVRGGAIPDEGFAKVEVDTLTYAANSYSDMARRVAIAMNALAERINTIIQTDVLSKDQQVIEKKTCPQDAVELKQEIAKTPVPIEPGDFTVSNKFFRGMMPRASAVTSRPEEQGIELSSMAPKPLPAPTLPPFEIDTGAQAPVPALVGDAAIPGAVPGPGALEVEAPQGAIPTMVTDMPPGAVKFYPPNPRRKGQVLKSASTRLFSGGSRKSTLKKRRGGKQNVGGTRRRKNRADRPHSHSR